MSKRAKINAEDAARTDRAVEDAAGQVGHDRGEPEGGGLQQGLSG